MRLRKQDVITSIRLPKEVDNKIQWIADQKYTDKSSIHRDALRKYLELRCRVGMNSRFF